MTNVRTEKFQSNFDAVKDSLLINSIGKTAIDSLRLRIPTKAIENLNINRLRQTTITINSNGEIENEQHKYKLVCDGFMLGLRSANSGKYKNPEELVIMFSSKVLGGEDYFKGITKETISIAYNIINSRLISKGIGNVTYRNFLDSNITDVDIKCDYEDSIGLLLNKVNRNIIDSSSSKRKTSQFALKGTATYKTGLQLGERKIGTQGSPFYKIYNKGLEIKKSIDSDINSFYLSLPSFKNDSKITNVWRAEVTMKNSSMLRANNLPNKLGNLLEIPEKQLSEVLQSNFMKWVKKEIKPIQNKRIRTGLNSEELLLLKSIERGLLFEDYLDILNSELGDISKRTIERKKKLFLELYNIIHDKGSESLEVSLESSKTDSNNLGSASSDMSSFCGGILYVTN